jgi:hypothetical protein
MGGNGTTDKLIGEKGGSLCKAFDIASEILYIFNDLSLEAFSRALHSPHMQHQGADFHNSSYEWRVLDHPIMIR